MEHVNARIKMQQRKRNIRKFDIFQFSYLDQLLRDPVIQSNSIISIFDSIYQLKKLA